jgi:outer membrane protein OmpU
MFWSQKRLLYEVSIRLFSATQQGFCVVNSRYGETGMKKLLLGTTAIIGALALSQGAKAQAGAPLTVTLGGAFQFNAGYVNEDVDQDRREYAGEYDASVLLGAEGKASENLVYGVKLQLLPDQNDDDAADEYYGYVSGTWGRVEAGAVDGAADRLTVFAPSDFGTGGFAGEYTDFITTTDTTGTEFFFNGINSIAGIDDLYKAFDSDDQLKVTYFSPRFAGFQVGASFAPDGSEDKDIGTANRNTRLSTSNIQGTTLAVSGFENFYEVGVNYVGEFSGVGVAASGSYVGASAKDPVTTAGQEYEDLAAYAAGLNLSYAGFTVGGGYVNNANSGYESNATFDDDGEGWNFGLQYATGPFIVGANALFAENEGDTATSGNSELSVYSVGTTFVVAPGFSTFVEANMFEYETDYITDSNDGSVVLVGAAMEF